MRHIGQWWRDAVIYQIYPRSFADSTGDGYGDLPGITAHLNYLAELGVDALWLSPFYASPMVDGGYDVADYRAVDPMFGTLADADALIARAHELGLRVIIDLVPNHTSSAHVWFQQALTAAPGSPERERYIFRDGKGADGALPPNNWRGLFGGIAWERVVEPDGTPGQWYLHMFDTTQPDLNWDNADVRAEFVDVLRFWLDRGVDGFRIDVAHSLVKAEGLPDWDEQVALVDSADAGADPGPMWDQEGVHEIYRQWHAVLAEYEHAPAMVAEAWLSPPSRLARYLRPDELQQGFNFDFLRCHWDAAEYREVIDASLAANDAVGATTTWVLSNHDVVRHASRFGLPIPGARPNGIGASDPQPDAAAGLRRARAATLFMLALPGSAYLYQGEELGLPDHTQLPDEVRQDPAWFRSGHTEFGRDGCRIPFPWRAKAPGLGFSPTGATWLPQPVAYRRLAADVQGGVESSTLEMYRKALRIRRALDVGSGPFNWLGSEYETLFGDPAYVLAFRSGPVAVMANIGGPPMKLPPGVHVLHASDPSAGVNEELPTDTTVWFTFV